MSRRSTLVFTALIAVAGCGGGGEPKATPSGIGGPGASVTPSATAEALPGAADGTRLSACHKRECEVLVSPKDKISPPPRFGVRTVIVEAITSEGVTYVGSGAGITLSLGGQRKGMTSYMNELAITTVAVQGGRAVVRFAKK